MQLRWFQQSEPRGEGNAPVGCDHGAQVKSHLQWGIHREEVPCQEQTATASSSMACLTAGSEKHAGTYFMHHVYACIYQRSVPVEHGLKNPQRSPRLILGIASVSNPSVSFAGLA